MVGTDPNKVSTEAGGEDNLSDKVKLDAKVDASFKTVKSSLDASITKGVKGLSTHSSPENENSEKKEKKRVKGSSEDGKLKEKASNKRRKDKDIDALTRDDLLKLVYNERARRSVKQIWDALEINHEGFKSLRKVMLGGFMTKFKKFKLEEGEPIKESQTRVEVVNLDLVGLEGSSKIGYIGSDTSSEISSPPQAVKSNKRGTKTVVESLLIRRRSWWGRLCSDEEFLEVECRFSDVIFYVDGIGDLGHGNYSGESNARLLFVNGRVLPPEIGGEVRCSPAVNCGGGLCRFSFSLSGICS
ncbi:hypothetical protein AgCh_023050 [Apium graveolens]